MARLRAVWLVLGLAIAPACASHAAAAVTGRRVRVEAPASHAMGLHEIEVWSGDENVARSREGVTFAGVSHRGRDINERKEGPGLVDGKADLAKRSLELTLAEGVGPWVEIDLGRDVAIDRVVVVQPAGLLYEDRGLRLVSVLDADRRVVWTGRYDIGRSPPVEGRVELACDTVADPLVGLTIPAGAAAWQPLGRLVEVEPAAAPPDAAARADRFAARQSPAELAVLARELCTRLDLDRPGLEKVKRSFVAGEHAAALDAFRDHFLAKLDTVPFMHEAPVRDSPYDLAADDLLEGVAIVFTEHRCAGRTFTPGAIDWAAVPPPEAGGVEAARSTALVGLLQKPLLSAYRSTGRAAYLEQWAAMTDDWGMNVRADLDRAADDLRFYFVMVQIESFNHIAADLARTARAQPEFAARLPGATLARLLIPVLEEYPPATWWVCRRASFNHTYNALIAATVTSRILDDFHAGQRLDRENRQHWERIWTANMTRDGSMNEIADEGHMFMQWRMAPAIERLKRDPPPWLTPDFLAEFATGWRQTAVYPVRHLAPDGLEHRFGRKSSFDKLWWLATPGTPVSELPACPTLDAGGILRQPEVAGMLQAAFGAGRDPVMLPPALRPSHEKVNAFYGDSFTAPAVTSDWMPYAGLHYLRRDWRPDATFVHMLSQPKGHPSTNGSAWNTEVHLFDLGQPLVALSPVWIDGLPPFNEAGTLTYKPGSKTETLATASELPIPARWHTSPFCDYAESFFDGVYQRHGVDHRAGELRLGDAAVAGRADRSVILLRPARLVIVTDAVRPREPGPRRYEIRQRFAIPESPDQKPLPAGRLAGSPAALTLVNETTPGIAVRRFTRAALAWDTRQTPDFWQNGASLIDHAGIRERLGGVLAATADGPLLMTALLEPLAAVGEPAVRGVTDLTGDAAAGFRAEVADGAALTWLAAAAPTALAAGPLTADAAGLLLYESGGTFRGLVLDATSLSVAGQPQALPATDCEFAIEQGRLTAAIPIRRPIEPVRFTPAEAVFTDSLEVALTSGTPGVEIRYTLDGTEPDLKAARYTGPLKITADTFLRARAILPGLTAIPFAAAGTEATVVSDARYRRRPLRPAAAVTGPLVPGLSWDLVPGSWRQLFSHLHLPEVMPARRSGTCLGLLDVSMRDDDGPFGVRYAGFLDVPADGVWTLHAPAEYVGASCEPGYDLRVWIDGEEWDLGQRFHGRGLWSVPLARGPHRLLVTFADARSRDRVVHDAGLWRDYPRPWVTWQGEAPVLEISGPGIPRQPIPDAWLRRNESGSP